MGSPRNVPVCFIYSGEGGQWIGMGAELLRREPVFRASIERAHEALQGTVEWSLLDQFSTDDGRCQLKELDVLHPTLTAFQIALTDLWRSWGIEPRGVVGHSIGEAAAAFVAGALTLEDTLHVQVARSRLFKRVVGRGRMASAELTLAEARGIASHYEGRACIGLSNSPTATVFTGDIDAIEEIAEGLRTRGVFCRTINVPLAPHSPQLDELHDDMMRDLSGIRPRPLTLPFFSSVRPEIGGRPEHGSTLDASYWWQQCRGTTLFADAVAEALRVGFTTFLELSPHPVLAEPVRQCMRHAKVDGHVFAPLRKSIPEPAAMRAALDDLQALPGRALSSEPNAACVFGASAMVGTLAAAAQDGSLRGIVFRASERSRDVPLRIVRAQRPPMFALEAIGADGTAHPVATVSHIGHASPAPQMDLAALRLRCSQTTRNHVGGGIATMIAMTMDPDSTEGVARFHIEPALEDGASAAVLDAVLQLVQVLRGGGIAVRGIEELTMWSKPTSTLDIHVRAGHDPDGGEDATFVATAFDAQDARVLALLRGTLASGANRTGDGASAPRVALGVGETLAHLVRVSGRLLKVDIADTSISLVQLGGDSLTAMELRNVVESELGVPLTTLEVLGASSLAALAARIVQARTNATDRPIVDPHHAEGSSFELSREQRRFLYLHQLNARNPESYVTVVLRFDGPFDVAAVREALASAVASHEALRTAFPLVAGRTVQRVSDAAVVPLIEVDLTGLPVAWRRAECDCIVDAEAQIAYPFDLTRGPLLKATLVRFDDLHHELIVRTHHIVTDYWSTNLLANEIGRTYLSLALAAPRPPTPGAHVRDFVLAEAESERSSEHRERLAFWKRTLAGAPVLELPTDRPRPATHTLAARSRVVTLPAELSQRIRAGARALDTTPFVFLLSAFYALLHRYSGQDDILVGSPTAARDRRSFERAIGPFIAWTVFRSRVHGDRSFRSLCEDVKAVVLNAYGNRLALEHMLAMQPTHDRSRNPLFQVLFDQLDKSPPLQRGDVTISSEVVEFRKIHFDLAMMVERTGEEVSIRLIYYADVFAEATAEALLGRYTDMLSRVADHPETIVADVPALAPPERPRIALVKAPPPARLMAVAATFTAEPVEGPLGFWSRKLAMPWRVEFAPFNQVFQELAGAGLLSGNKNGLNVVLVRIDDLGERPQAALEDLEAVLRAFARRQASPTLMLFCPSRPERRESALGLERAFVDRLRDLAGVYLFASSEIERLYPVASYFDAALFTETKAPYTMPSFAALATTVARKTSALLRPTYKVIVVDCDQTLWRGVAGEDGPLGVEIDPPRRALQEALVEGVAKGMLVCLCSKNSEADVDAVFEAQQTMPLRPEHVVARRINWNPKSDNIRSLATQLGLGLNSFVFIDDNPIECEEVRASCPEVAVLEVPAAQPEEIPVLLRHFWPLDRLVVTAEDAARTTMYKQSAAREELRDSSSSFREFLAKLELDIRIAAMTEDTRPRVAQLTTRTNQFNTTTIRRTETEVAQLCANGHRCFTVDVADRFGSHGLVGVVLHRDGDDAVVVDSMLLSCRALGRGVEHRMLAHVGNVAVQKGLRHVDVPFVASKKNQPARDFLDSIATAVRLPQADASVVYRLVANDACTLTFAPVDSRPPEDAAVEPKRQARGGAPDEEQYDPRIWQEIACELHDPEAIAQASTSAGVQARHDLVTRYEAPRSDAERTLAAIWQRVLRIDRVGRNDDYFELGGDSIRAIQILGLAREAGLHLELGQLLETPTIASLAAGAVAQQRGPTIDDLVGLLPRAPLEPDDEDGYPLVSTQSLMLANYSAEAGFYHFQQALHFEEREGEVDLDSLSTAFCRVAARQSVMRTVLRGNVQIVRREFRPVVQHVDLRAAGSELDARLAALLQEDRRAPFDPTENAATRITLARRSQTEFEYITSGHHAFGDAWGYLHMLDRVFDLYAALKRGDDAAATEIVAASVGRGNSYKEYVALERHAGEQAELREFWEARLRALTPSSFPAQDRARREIFPPLQIELSEEVTAAAQERARAQRVTLKSLLLTAYFDALAEVLGEAPCVGIVTNGRSDSLSDPLRTFGLFWRFLPVVRAAGGRGQVRAVHDMLVASEARAMYPFENIVGFKGFDPIRATFNFIHFADTRWDSGQGPVSLRGTRVLDRFHYPLNLKVHLDRTGRCITVTLSAASGLVDIDGAQRLLEHFVRMLSAEGVSSASAS